ncbi:transposase [Paludibacterium sp. dN 18-1]|uniref:Transposase n=1 Tax=Paludibacterium denitrificans TaxID=2675226 RepID=A0A844GCC1_9NEIS|nr:transposase [Paludibacterium denitrificans]
MDSTGIKMMGEVEWKVKKHGADYRCQWCKLHLGIDAQTLEIRAMEVTDNRTSDTTMLPERQPQIPKAEQLVTVTTDGAYDTRLCHAAIAARGAASIIPSSRNCQLNRLSFTRYIYGCLQSGSSHFSSGM